MSGFSDPFASVGGAVQGIFTSLLNRLILAAIILLVGFIVGRLIGRLAHRLLHEMEMDRFIALTTGLKFSMEGLLGALVSYLIYFVAIVMALEELGLNTFLFNLLATAVIAIVLLSILLALKDFIPNVFAGFFVQRRGMLRPGDLIRIDGVEGKVLAVQVVETKLETRGGDVIFIPNGMILKKEMVRKKRR